MATYAIGDVQGCYTELRSLLAAIRFDAASDQLWFVGDLVNRGPDSLAVLRFVAALEDRAVCVLGNHDLHLLACAHVDGRRPRSTDTLQAVLAAEDREALLEWLRRRPLLHHDADLGFTLVHAGLPPPWDLATAQAAAAEVEAWLGGADFVALLTSMYGTEPDAWSDAVDREGRCRYTINACTRMRYCHADGRLEFTEKGAGGRVGLLPWFEFAARRSRGLSIVFGHWSTLQPSPRRSAEHRVFPIDTGCVWGGSLTALRLDDLCYFSVPSVTRGTLI